jgi:hypothetical protein
MRMRHCRRFGSPLCTYKWNMVGQPDNKVQRFYRVRRGAEREVDYTEPVTGDSISAHQSGNQDCKPSVRIWSTFGKPPYEDQY